ncbi:MAG: endonuclease III [Candidatus Aenigmatarchaeota archaeon]
MERTERIREIVFKYHSVRSHHSKESAFRSLVRAVLSQRTRDINTDIATENLFRHASTPEDILKLGSTKIVRLIEKSGFYRQKSKNIVKLCKILVNDYHSRVPSSRELLLSLPGVGYKTADIVLLYAYDVPTIPVDVHVEVVSKRLGLVGKNAKYEEIRKTLEKMFVEKERLKVNSGMVEFGQTICLTAKPKCYMCPLVDICIYEKKNIAPPKGFYQP